VEAISPDASLCLKLPADVDHEDCALLGVTGVGMRHVRRIRVSPPQNVLVFGQGPIGLGASQSAKAFGAYVTAVDMVQKRLDVAKELGIHRCINASEPSAMEQLKQRAPYNCIIDASGAISVLEDIRKNGLLAHKGAIGLLAVRSETTFQWGMLHILEASFEVSCHFSFDDLNVIIHFMKLGTMKIKPMVTHRVSITDAPRIYGIMRDQPGELLGVIFNWK
jgi:L-iditol 2-dehydrogenase